MCILVVVGGVFLCMWELAHDVVGVFVCRMFVSSVRVPWVLP